jgi:hypothetical protein
MENQSDQGQAWEEYHPQQPPYGGYQQPYQGYQPPSYIPGSAPPPRPQPDLASALRELPAQWQRVLLQPGATSFAQEMPKASWRMLWTTLIGYAIIVAILGAIKGALFSAVATFPGFSGQSSLLVSQFLATTGGFGAILGIPIGFFIGQGILFGIARLFGGSGTFLHQGYLSLLFSVPLGILVALIGFIPVLGGIVGFVITVYEIILQIFVIQAAHRLSGGKATAVVLLPVAIAIILAIVIVIAMAALFISTSHIR